MRSFEGVLSLAALLLSASCLAQNSVGAADFEGELGLRSGKVSLLAQPPMKGGESVFAGSDQVPQGSPMWSAKDGFVIPTQTSKADSEFFVVEQAPEWPAVRPQVFDLSAPVRSSTLPEPITLAVIAAGLFGLAARRGRRSRMI